jgi:VanZ family protein
MRFFKYHLPVILYAGGIFISSTITPPPDILDIVSPFPHSDKLFHALVYCIFALLLLRSFQASRPCSAEFFLKITAFTAAFSYGIIIEIYQYFLPARSMELMDIFSNGIGAFIGILFFSKIHNAKTSKGRANVKDNTV